MAGATRRSARHARPRAARRPLASLAVAAVLVGAGYLAVAPGSTGALFTDQAANGGNTVTTLGTYDQRVKALGPIGYWRLNETTVANGTAAADSSGNGNTGTYVAGDLYWSSTNSGWTSGNGYQYMTLNVPSTYTIQAGDRFEYDMEPVIGSVYQQVDFQTTAGTVLRNSGLSDQNGITADPSGSVPANFTPGIWYHRVFTIPAGNALVGTTINAIMLVNEAESAATQNAHFANIRMTNSAGAIVKSFWAAGDPVPTLSLLYASPSQGTNTITASGVVARVTASPLAIYGGSAPVTSLNGNASGVTVSSPALDMAGRSAFSIEAWVKSGSMNFSLPGSGIVARQENTADGTYPYEQYVVDYYTGTVRFAVRDTATNAVTITGPNINDDNWHYVVATYNAGAMSLYVDGSLVATGTDPNGLLAMPAGTKTYIATRPSWYSSWKTGWAGVPGSVTEVAIYPTALTPAQIQDHWLHH